MLMPIKLMTMLIKLMMMPIKLMLMLIKLMMMPIKMITAPLKIVHMQFRNPVLSKKPPIQRKYNMSRPFEEFREMIYF
jgi:hypothetical protein